MNTFKSLVAVVVLTFALTVSAAGQAPVCNPGETHSPPCLSTLVTEEDAALMPVETQTLPEVQIVEIVSLFELALSVLLLA
jgi:hypothetical protein